VQGDIYFHLPKRLSWGSVIFEGFGDVGNVQIYVNHCKHYSQPVMVCIVNHYMLAVMLSIVQINLSGNLSCLKVLVTLEMCFDQFVIIVSVD